MLNLNFSLFQVSKTCQGTMPKLHRTFQIHKKILKLIKKT